MDSRKAHIIIFTVIMEVQHHDGSVWTLPFPFPSEYMNIEDFHRLNHSRLTQTDENKDIIDSVLSYRALEFFMQTWSTRQAESTCDSRPCQFMNEKQIANIYEAAYIRHMDFYTFLPFMVSSVAAQQTMGDPYGIVLVTASYFGINLEGKQGYHCMEGKIIWQDLPILVRHWLLKARGASFVNTYLENDLCKLAENKDEDPLLWLFGKCFVDAEARDKDNMINPNGLHWIHLNFIDWLGNVYKELSKFLAMPDITTHLHQEAVVRWNRV